MPLFFHCSLLSVNHRASFVSSLSDVKMCNAGEMPSSSERYIMLDCDWTMKPVYLHPVLLTV